MTAITNIQTVTLYIYMIMQGKIFLFLLLHTFRDETFLHIKSSWGIYLLIPKFGKVTFTFVLPAGFGLELNSMTWKKTSIQNYFDVKIISSEKSNVPVNYVEEGETAWKENSGNDINLLSSELKVFEPFRHQIFPPDWNFVVQNGPRWDDRCTLNPSHEGILKKNKKTCRKCRSKKNCLEF